MAGAERWRCGEFLIQPMHEMSLCVSMVDLLTEQLSAEGAQRIVRIEVEIGALGHVEPEALAFCFSSAAQGTPAAGAELAIRVQPGQALCLDCQRRVRVNQHLDPCPECGGYALQIDSGDQLRVIAMEVI